MMSSSPCETATASERLAMSDLATLTSELTLSNTDTVQDDSNLEATKSSISIDELLVESFEWLQNRRRDNLEKKVLSSWMLLGDKKIDFDENTKYGDKNLVNKLALAFKELDGLSEHEIRTLREKVNPLEFVKKAFLLNRSSVKFANIDSLMDYMFSNPMDKRNHSLIQPNELMYFVDIGGGSGGFVDYLLWRRDWQTKGFGFPLKGYNYHSNRFTTGAQRFTCFSGANRDGDATNEDNIESFDRYVKQHVTLGVHVVIADCAYNIEERKYAKETIFKRLHLGEIIMALSLLRQNGHFILKLYDIFLPFTVGLVYLLHRCFAEICLIKPKTCRPSNSERYLICKWMNSNSESVRLHLLEVNKTMHHLKTTNCDVIQLVPEDVLLGDTQFYDFICKSNNVIGELQLDAMLKIIELKNKESKEQAVDASWIDKCLLRWNVLPKSDENVFVCTFGEWTKTFIDIPDNSLTSQLPLEESFNLPGDMLGNEWHFIPVGNLNNNKRSFYATTSSSTNVMKFDYLNSDWIDVPDIGLEFPVNTFLYGEIIYHHAPQRDGKKPIPPYGFHIIDGLILNGQDIRSQPFLSRLKLCQKFADAINNPSRYIKNQKQENIQSAAIYCKESFPLTNLICYIEDIRKSWKTLQNGSKVLGLNVRTFLGPKRFYEVKGLLFLRHYPKILDDNNFTETFKCRQLWSWDRPYEILNTVDIKRTFADEFVYLSHFCQYMNVDSRQLNSNSRVPNRRDVPSRYSSNRGNRGNKSNRGFRK